MGTLLTVGLSNAVVAAALALLAIAVERTLRRPALSHCCWLLVLMKPVTPPLVSLPWPRVAAPAMSPAGESNDATGTEYGQPIAGAAPAGPALATQDPGEADTPQSHLTYGLILASPGR